MGPFRALRLPLGGSLLRGSGCHRSTHRDAIRPSRSREHVQNVINAAERPRIVRHDEADKRNIRRVNGECIRAADFPGTGTNRDAISCCLRLLHKLIASRFHSQLIASRFHSPGQASANARMYLRLRGDSPVMS